MSGPTRDSIEGRVYLDLQNKARREGRPNAELQQLYVLEGFLARLAVSPHRDRFVLKGGVLLAAFGTRRPTRDVDFQALHLANDTATVSAVIGDVAGIVLDDGLIFNSHAARDEDEYSGVRVTMTATLARAQLTFHIDVNVGDPVWPAPVIVSVPRLLGGDALALSGYPLPMVHAEKLVTALQRGTVNTRWRDFADVWTLSGTHPVNGDELRAASRVVADYRGVALARLEEVLDGYPALAQGKWAAWRRKQQMLQLPEEFNDLLQAVIAFADPCPERAHQQPHLEPHRPPLAATNGDVNDRARRDTAGGSPAPA